MRRIARWLCFLLVMMGAGAQLNGQSVNIGWVASSDPTAIGYIFGWGMTSGNYTSSENVETNTAVTISNLTAGTTYYFAASSYNASGLEGVYSSEIAVTLPAATTFVFTNLTQSYSGSRESVTVITSPANTPVTVTYSGSTNAPVNTGSYTVVAMAQSTGSGTATTGSATGMFSISPAMASLVLGNLMQIYNGNARKVTSTTTPSGLAAITTYNGNATAPTNSGSYTVVGTVNNSNYVGNATNTLVIAKAAGTVTLSGLNQKQTGSPIVVQSRTVPAGLTVNITYNGSPQPPTMSGSYTVVGTIVNANYKGTVTNTLNVSGKSRNDVAADTAQVTLFSLNQIYDGTPKSVGVVTVPSGLAVFMSYSLQGADGTTNDTPVEEGSYTVTATVSDTNYTGGATDTLTIYDLTQVLVLFWPTVVSNPTIYTSTNRVDWLPLGINLGPTNQVVIPKQSGNQFFQGPGLQLLDPSQSTGPDNSP